MCNFKRFFIITLFGFLILNNLVYGKKSKKSRRPQNDEEETTTQPNVVTYSTFGFNDVGPTYDGFVPSSPDYASYLSNYNPESSTRLYAPAFPTAMDNSQFNGYGQQTQEGQIFSSNGGEPEAQASMVQYESNSFDYGSPSNFGPSNEERQLPNFGPTNAGSQNQQEGSDQKSEDFNSPVYGTKLSGKTHRYRSPNYGNNNSSTFFGSAPINSGGDKFARPEIQNLQESKPTFGESASNYYNTYNYAPTYPPSNGDEVSNLKPTSSVRFQKVVDFTKFKPTYPTEVENKYATATLQPNYGLNSPSNRQNENIFLNSYYNSINEMNLGSKFKENSENDHSENTGLKSIGTNYMEYSVNHIDNSNTKNSFMNKNVKPISEYKDKFKNRPWNYSSDFSNWKNALKNQEYSSDFMNHSYKRPYKSHVDEVTSSSNNVIDLTNYRFPESEYTNFKKIPEYQQQSSDSYPSIQSLKYQDNMIQGDNEYFNQFKGLYSTVPTTTLHWSNFFRATETPPHKSRPKRPQLNDDEVVHIPKRHKYHIKHHGNKPSEWSSHTRHVKGKPLEDWRKDVSNRFKSEEDLMGLRNHDTSHPNYLPTFKLTNDAGEEFQKYMSENDYKSLVEKWRQSYMKSKYFKDSSAYRDHEAYGSDSRPLHVPVPRPFPIEVPHPVIVPVPQPYPVRVPVPKPVAVPVIRELTVPIEKPVPYPVIKKVPYPVEKLVPVPVEKEVPVPVMKPYAVPIPHVRPVFHHTRHPFDEESERDGDIDEDDYHPRPAESSLRGKKIVKYAKKTRSNRNKPRRPSSGSYYDRNRRRWPARRPSGYRSDSARLRRPRPTPEPLELTYKNHDYETDDYDHDHKDYFDYCKRTGNC